MFISKKTLQNKLREERNKAYEQEQESEQWTKIYKLEKEVKKLKKIVRKTY